MNRKTRIAASRVSRVAGALLAGTLISEDSGCAGTPATGSYRLVVTEMDGDAPVTRADGPVIHSFSVLRAIGISTRVG